MENSKILKARQFKKNEALNKIRKIYDPKYKFPYNQSEPFGDFDDFPSCAEERETSIKYIIEQLEEDLDKLKVVES